MPQVEISRNLAAARWSTALHGKFFDRMFPTAPGEFREKAVRPFDTTLHESGMAFFKRGQELLPGSRAFFDPQRMVLITDAARHASLPESLKDGFIETEVLESRSHRARFFVAENGEAFEFKGLTPVDFDLSKLNPNSNQPRGLFESGHARREFDGLQLTGGVRSAVNELGEWFGDLKGFSQLLRAGRPGERFYPWMRMDESMSTLQLLARLEGKDLETFLYESHVRFGRQLRKLHDAGMTLCNPFRRGTAMDEPFYSSLHSGNVEPHGNLIDLEGMMGVNRSEEAFNGYIRQNPDSLRRVSRNLLEHVFKNPFSFTCRVADLHRYFESRNNLERSIFKQTFSPSGRHRLFMSILSGTIRGYYQAENLRDLELGDDTDKYLASILDFIKEREFNNLRFGILFRTIEEIEGQAKPVFD